MKLILLVQNLGTATCEYVTDSDLQQGKELVWQYKGVPYTVEIVDIHGIANSWSCSRV